MKKGRPSKMTIDYFPHFTTSGKTLFTLESLYGNDGYAFWFKLLEILGATDGHIFCYEKQADWLFLVAKTNVSEEKALSILKTLSELGAIDEQLYTKKTVWSDNFVANLIPVYSKRKTEMPHKPILRGEKYTTSGISGEKIPQSKVKERKVLKDLCINDAPQEDFYLTKKKKKLTGQKMTDFFIFWKVFSYPKGKAEAADSWLEVYKPERMEEILSGAKAEAAKRPELIATGRTPKMAQGWLSGRRWEDEDNVVSCETCDYKLNYEAETTCWQEGRTKCEAYRKSP